MVRSCHKRHKMLSIDRSRVECSCGWVARVFWRMGDDGERSLVLRAAFKKHAEGEHIQS